MVLSVLTVVLSQAASTDVRRVAREQEAFGVRLLRAVASPSQNTIISPNNALYALAGLLPGSSGETQGALQLALGVMSTPEEKQLGTLKTLFSSNGRSAEFQTAAGAWVDDALRLSPDYSASLSQLLEYKIENLDLQSPRAGHTINAWVSKQTKGRIPAIAPAFYSRQTVLVLTSAIYFKGMWRHLMTPMQQPLSFGASGKQCKGMGCNAILPRLDQPAFRAVSVPLGASSAEFYVPKGDATPESIADLLSKHPAVFPATGSDTTLRMPYWRCEWSGSIRGPLSRIGLSALFQPRNELDKVAQGAVVSDVTHRTWIDVNENGIEAAAATSIGLGFGYEPKPETPTPFSVDRPFFFVLRDNDTGAALFMGIVYEPTPA